jgi:dihydropteroate synthase
MTPYQLKWGPHQLTIGQRTLVMGIVNVTPDSFSDGGRFFDAADAVARAEQLVADGADLIDIGGESTRPYAEEVSTAEEIRRVIPVIEDLIKRVTIPISIDTTKSEVARRAIEAGAAVINDIGAMRFDPRMPHLAADCGVPVILMHMQGSPRTMQMNPHYDDLFGEISAFLKQARDQVVRCGVQPEKVILDPGIGFGKTSEHNLMLIRDLKRFRTLDSPIMMGTSRKAFIRKILKPDHLDDIQADLTLVETGTQATVAAAVLNGAHMVRVHNVAATKATVKIIDAIKAASGAPAIYANEK